MTIRELKAQITELPEQDMEGREYCVWRPNGKDTYKQAGKVIPLNAVSDIIKGGHILIA